VGAPARAGLEHTQSISSIMGAMPHACVGTSSWEQHSTATQACHGNRYNCPGCALRASWTALPGNIPAGFNPFSGGRPSFFSVRIRPTFRRCREESLFTQGGVTARVRRGGRRSPAQHGKSVFFEDCVASENSSAIGLLGHAFLDRRSPANRETTYLPPARGHPQGASTHCWFLNQCRKYA